MKNPWHVVIDDIKPFTFRITTPEYSGTGFLLWKSGNSSLCAIATAAHVVERAKYWEQPIRLHNDTTGESILLREADRAILINDEADEAAIVFNNTTFKLGPTPPELLKEKSHLKPGVQIGWLGYPAIKGAGLCFFSGSISAYLKTSSRYLVDGVAINGVSGGPAFWLGDVTPSLVGVVSAYIPNRATGETLPGVAEVVDVTELHQMVGKLRDIFDAKKKETTPSEPPAPVSQDGAKPADQKPAV